MKMTKQGSLPSSLFFVILVEEKIERFVGVKQSSWCVLIWDLRPTQRGTSGVVFGQS